LYICTTTDATGKRRNDEEETGRPVGRPRWKLSSFDSSQGNEDAKNGSQAAAEAAVKERVDGSVCADARGSKEKEGRKERRKEGEKE
jgi:hypothetical protein